MLLHISDTSQETLHAQISKQIRIKILSGQLTEGEMLPSIRSLARELKVSVITVQKSYDDLAQEGLIMPRHGKGFFIVGLTDKQKSAITESRFLDTLKPVVKEAISAGMSKDEIKGAVEKILKSED